MTQNENSNAQDWGFLKFDPIVLVRDVARRWALILLAVLVISVLPTAIWTFSMSRKDSIAD